MQNACSHHLCNQKPEFVLTIEAVDGTHLGKELLCNLHMQAANLAHSYVDQDVR